jgi:hypothetical protein
VPWLAYTEDLLGAHGHWRSSDTPAAPLARKLTRQRPLAAYPDRHDLPDA